MLVITGIFFVAEIVAGYLGNSLALVSDSFNMLSDILSLCVGLASGRLSRRPASPRCTFGLGRAEVVGALANAAFLAALCFSVSAEALKRLVRPEAVDEPFIVLVVGSLGLAVNIVGLLVFQDCRWLCGRKKERRDPSTACDGKIVMNGEAGALICAPSVFCSTLAFFTGVAYSKHDHVLSFRSLKCVTGEENKNKQTLLLFKHETIMKRILTTCNHLK